MVYMKGIIKSVAVFIIVMLCFVYFGNFTNQQAALLALLAVFLYGHLKEKEIKNKFEPFSIQIFPKWYQILKDHKLVDDKKWKEIQEKIYKDPSEKYNVLKNGITFTILKPEPQLVFNNNRNYFSADVDFREKIEEIETAWGELNLKYTPEFYIKWGLGQYELGITTGESFSKVVMVGDDNELIPLATLPYAEFLPYYGVDINGQAKLKLDQKLKELGWERDDYAPDDIIGSFPSSLKHKYFDVNYKGI